MNESTKCMSLTWKATVRFPPTVDHNLLLTLKRLKQTLTIVVADPKTEIQVIFAVIYVLEGTDKLPILMLSLDQSWMGHRH